MAAVCLKTIEAAYGYNKTAIALITGGYSGLLVYALHQSSTRGKPSSHECVVSCGELLAADRVRYREAVTPLGTAACKHLAAVGSFHPLAEAMLVDSLPV